MTNRVRNLLLSVALLAVPACAAAQSDDLVSLGDLARAVRKNRAAPAQTVIDNDNLSQVMDQADSRKLAGAFVFSFSPSDKDFKVSSLDATCSLSFNANATALLVNPFTPLDVPQDELVKLDGPAIIDGDSLQVSVYNGSAWTLREITVGLTIVRGADTPLDNYNEALLSPPPGENPLPEEKHSDQTVLVHMKGSATPFTTTIFRQKLQNIPGPDQEWHWAFVQAKGIPPDPSENTPATTTPSDPGYAGSQ